MSGPIVLAIDTSGPVGQVALGPAGGAPTFTREFPTGPRAGGGLFVALEECLAASAKPQRILVGVGPGSYAGVRLAIAAATGLGLALGIEPVAIPSVCAYDVAAMQFQAIGDARRGSFYYTAVREGRCGEGPEICNEMELREKLNGRPNWPVYSVEKLVAFPQARQTNARAARLLVVPPEDQPRPLEPIYLREPHITKPRPILPAPVRPLADPGV